MKNISLSQKSYLKIHQKNESLKQVIFNIFVITNKRMKVKMIINIFFSFLSGILDSVAIGSIIPFLYVLISPEKIYESNFIQRYIPFLLDFETNKIVLTSFLFVILVNILSSIFKIYIIKFTLKISAECGSFFAKYAFKNIINKDLISFRKMEITKYINILIMQTNNTVAFIDYIQFLLSGAILSLMIIITCLFINLEASLICLIGLTSAYLIISYFTRKENLFLSKRVLQSSNQYFKTVKDSLSLYRPINLMNLDSFYGNNIYDQSLNFRYLTARGAFTSKYPKFLIEASAIVLISSISFFAFKNNSDASQVLSLMAAIALAAQKLLPNLQLVYLSWSRALQKKTMAFNVVDNIIEFFLAEEKLNRKIKLQSFSKLRLRSVYFSFDSKKNYILENINLEIKKGEFIAIKGNSGEGKTTLMDLMIGFISPTKGELNFKNKLNQYQNISLELNEWKSIIGYVPQEIDLINTSVAGNIALNESLNTQKRKKIIKLLEIVNLKKLFINENEIFDRFIGDSGVLLSGGQRQRLSIARSLYKDPAILFLDEATNGLDKETEYEVISNIRYNFPLITMITISHRDSLLKLCDKIYLLKNKNLVKLEKV